MPTTIKDSESENGENKKKQTEIQGTKPFPCAFQAGVFSPLQIGIHILPHNSQLKAHGGIYTKPDPSRH